MRRRILASTGLVFGLLAWNIAASEDVALSKEAAERMLPVVPAAINYYNERSDDPLPVLTTSQIEDLLKGDVIRIRRHPGRDVENAPERVTGYRIVALPRERVWVAALDPDFQATELLTEHLLNLDGGGVSVWHQYLSLPWPIADRQWVIRVGARTELAAETNNLVWELSWDLEESGEEIARASISAGDMGKITPEAAKDAVYVPANQGSWIMFKLENGITLIGYRIIVRVGGSIPDSWIATFGMAQLSQVLDSVAHHADEIGATYNPTDHPIHGGDGKVIGRF
jgi:hypothetical protein